MKRLILQTLATTSSIMYLSSPAAAQEQAVSAAAPQDGEIVVTATKRSTTLQSTPMSITAISSSQLNAADATSVSDLVQRAPGVSFSSAGAGRSTFSIRGISSAAGSSPTVGFYLDDIPITPPTDTGAVGRSFIDPNLFDLERVEVLRGPQGTLYGAGSMGGTIRLITGQPEFGSLRGAVELAPSYTSHGGANISANAMVNIPLGAAAAIRIVGSSKYQDGFIDAIAVSPFPATTVFQRGDVANAPVSARDANANTLSQQSIRGILAIKPSDRLSLSFSAFYQALSAGAADTIDNPPGRLAHYGPKVLDESFTDRFQLYSATAKLDLGFGELTSSTGYLKRHVLQGEDGSEIAAALLGTPEFPVQSIQTHDSRQTSEELRLTSKGTGKLQWIVGGFYSDFKNKYTSPQDVPEYIPIFGTSNLATYDVAGSIRQYAAFGEATYRLTSRLSVMGGIRWNKFRQDSSLVSSGIVAAAPPFNNQDVTSRGTSVTPKASISYTASRDLLLYATYAKGSRVGGPNLQVPVSGPVSCAADLANLGLGGVPSQFRGDTVSSYEAGVKTQWFDRALTINGSGFYIDWNNIQQQVRLASCGFSFTGNLGKAVSKGFDLEVSARLGEHVRLGFTGGYTDAHLAQGVPGAGSKGDPIQNTPRWTTSQSVELSYPLDEKWTARLEARNEYYDKSVDVLGAKPSYDLVNASIGANTDRIDAKLFVKNLTNERADLQNTLSQLANIPAYNRIAINQPRTIGISIGYRY